MDFKGIKASEKFTMSAKISKNCLKSEAKRITSDLVDRNFQWNSLKKNKGKKGQIIVE